MKTLKLIAALMLVATAATASSTETEKDAKVKKALETFLDPNGNAKVESITKSPYAGLYEVRVRLNGGVVDIFYTDEGGKNLFFGHVYDVVSKRDYTKEKLEELNKIKFSDLPLNQALKMVKGKGTRKIAIFEDPNCGYCKRFRETLEQVDNITIYTFMYNILSPQSAEISKNAWCSPDRNKAWDDWMLRNKQPAVAGPDCKSPNDQIFALGNKLGVTGTPTIFFADGTRISGAVDVASLEKKLASIK
ncbi:MAG: DsbC family protein [Paucimonas sp.]|nr:DsbC family protein [Paucimonas sp.]